MIKLNIQRFGHTNSTTNYELPQFIGTDKPQWLTDINQAFLAIDTNLYSASSSATLANTSIGTLSDLTTTAKTDVVSAINEVDSDLGTLSTTVANHTIAIGDNTTAIGTLANLSTTAKTDLVSAVNEVDNVATTNASSIGTLANLDTTVKTDLVSAVNEVNGLFNKFNLVNSTVYTSVASSSNCNYSSGNITLMANDDYSIFKLYGNMRLQLTNNTDGRVEITLASNLRPDQEYAIDPVCGVFSSAGAFLGTAFCEVKTNGNLVIAYWGGKSHGEYQNLYLTPCLYFNKNFGDTPTP